jgi:hypothetical protein
MKGPIFEVEARGVLLVPRMQIEADKSLGSAATPSSSSSSALASFRSGEPKRRGAQSLPRARFARLLCVRSAQSTAVVWDVLDDMGMCGCVRVIGARGLNPRPVYVLANHICGASHTEPKTTISMAQQFGISASSGNRPSQDYQRGRIVQRWFGPP